MAIRDILTYPDPRLRQPGKPVVDFDDDLKQLIADMVETMYADNGCGLAATQLGIALNIFVADFSGAGDEPQHFINPEILKREALEVKTEGCLSFPGTQAKVLRPTRLEMRYFDQTGQAHQAVFTDIGAHCCDHEIEHLQGTLFIDHLSPIKRNFLLKKLKKHLKTT